MNNRISERPHDPGGSERLAALGEDESRRKPPPWAGASARARGHCPPPGPRSLLSPAQAPLPPDCSWGRERVSEPSGPLSQLLCRRACALLTPAKALGLPARRRPDALCTPCLRLTNWAHTLRVCM